MDAAETERQHQRSPSPTGSHSAAAPIAMNAAPAMSTAGTAKSPQAATPAPYKQQPDAGD